MANFSTSHRNFDLNDIAINNVKNFKCSVHGLTVPFRVKRKGSVNRSTYHVKMNIVAKDLRKLRFIFRYGKHPQISRTDFVTVDNYDRKKEYATFIDDGSRLLMVTVESESVISHFHDQKLKSFYELSKKSGDILLTPSRCEISEDRKEEEKHEAKSESGSIGSIGTNVDEDGVRGIRMSSLLLRSSSEVFSKMLTNPMREQKEKTIEIDTNVVDVIDDFVYFLTVGSLRSTSTLTVLTLLELSHLYRIAPLNYACLEALCENVESCSLVQTLTAFDRWSYDDEIAMDLYKQLVDKVKRNREALMINNKSQIPKWWRALIQC